VRRRQPVGRPLVRATPVTPPPVSLELQCGAGGAGRPVLMAQRREAFELCRSQSNPVMSHPLVTTRGSECHAIDRAGMLEQLVGGAQTEERPRACPADVVGLLKGHGPGKPPCLCPTIKLILKFMRAMPFVCIKAGQVWPIGPWTSN
jgi:hypothetical protein